MTLPRACLLGSVAVCWLNYLLTERWAGVPGALHGAREPWFVLALAAVTAIAWIAPIGTPVRAPMLSRIVGIAAPAVLLATFFIWFPADTWTQIPFLDNWPARYQSTLDQIRLLGRGTFVGWQWAFLGGYHLSSDMTVALGVLAWVPVALLGDTIGFHALHLALFAALPALVWLHLREDGTPDVQWLAAGVTAIVAGNYSYMLVRSGDTNSLAAVVATMFALYAARLMRRHRWGGPLLIAALTLVAYSHAAFLLFAIALLGVDVALSRDWRWGGRIALAVAAAAAMTLPLTWETWRYPGYFTSNNSVLDAPPFDAVDFARKIFYNVELLARPDRWSNDSTGLVMVFLPVFALAAFRAPGRVRFHACAAALALLIVRFYNPPMTGWSPLRVIHLYPVFAGPVLAWFVVTQAGSRVMAAAVVALIASYVQVSYATVPHLRDLREFNAPLVERIRQAPPALVLIENSFHPDMDADPAGSSEPTPFAVHFEALLPAATGQRFYAGVWDGWQWAPARRNLLANGTLAGRSVSSLSDADLTSELRRWGIRDLFVWSERATDRLSTSAAFASTWRDGRWTHFEMIDADVRTVVTSTGAGRLTQLDPLRAMVDLERVTEGELIVIRTNYHPAWAATYDGRAVPLRDHDGQLSFVAPASGSYTVELRYPRRLWLWGVAGVAFVMGSWTLIGRRRPTNDLQA